MSRGVNLVMLIGNLGADPIKRLMPNGDAATRMRIATGEKEYVEWHTIDLYGKLAEIAAQYLHKGSKVYVEGPVRYEKWKDKEGIERTLTKIAAKGIRMLDTKPKDTNVGSNNPKDINEEDDLPF